MNNKMEFIIDMRKIIGSYSMFDEDCENYLAVLITKTCQNQVKRKISLEAKEQFGWTNGSLMPYVVAKVMGLKSMRYTGSKGEIFISSSEWLCGILNCGSPLEVVHIKFMMSLVNPLVSIYGDVYFSGKDIWHNAPGPVRNLLNILDNAALTNSEVKIIFPEIISDVSIDILQNLLPQNIREMSKIEWS